MKPNNNVVYHIDYASGSQLTGWAIDLNNGKFPTSFEIKHDSYKKNILDLGACILRSDVCKNFATAENERLGFQLNLYDLFNSHIDNYSLIEDDSEIWTYENFINSLDTKENELNEIYFNEIGTKQVVIVYKNNDQLHRNLSTLINKNLNTFNPTLNRNIKYTIHNINLINDKNLDAIELKNDDVILITSTDCFKSLNKNYPIFLQIKSKIILNEYINLTEDYSGILSSLCRMSGIENNQLITASLLYKLITKFSCYPDLFFKNSKENLYVHQSGKAQVWMNKFVKEKIQCKVKCDIAILSMDPIYRISTLTKSNASVFININSLKFVYDIIDSKQEKFVNEAYKRGLKVIRINKDGRL